MRIGSLFAGIGACQARELPWQHYDGEAEWLV